MALSTKLEIKQGQSLVMTPQLMQAIKLLQMNNLDLTAFVDEELERNPLLERDSDSPVSGEDGGSIATPDAEAGSAEHAEPLAPAPAEPDAIHSAETPSSGTQDAASDPTQDWLDNDLDADLGNMFPDDAPRQKAEEAPGPIADPGLLGGDSWAGVGSGGVSSAGYDPEAFLASEQSLHDSLTDQLSVATDDPQLRLIGAMLIDAIDESGYLQTDLESVAIKLGTQEAQVEDVLALVQGLEPTGIAARDLVECLTLQLKDTNRFDPAMACLLANLDLLARHELAALQDLCAVDDEDFAEMLDELRQLNPKPGLAFGSTNVQSVVPDVFVRPGPDGGWLIELNSETLPKVLVNEVYAQTLSSTARSDDEKTYVSDCLQTANWLVKSLDQRARTILKVASELVRQQDAFFAHGIAHLRPLNLKTVADAIEMHESTVSRVTSGKYIATTRGIFAFKYFFTSAIQASGGGEAHAAEAVRHRIKGLIDQETAKTVLSDDALVKALKADGIDIARRTIAKYREAMRIPSSVQRRREKKAAEQKK